MPRRPPSCSPPPTNHDCNPHPVPPVQSKNWTEIPCEGRVPPPRHSHRITVHRDQLYLLGGLDELGAQSVAMYRVALPAGQQVGAGRRGGEGEVCPPTVFRVSNRDKKMGRRLAVYAVLRSYGVCSSPTSRSR